MTFPFEKKKIFSEKLKNFENLRATWKWFTLFFIILSTFFFFF